MSHGRDGEGRDGRFHMRTGRRGPIGWKVGSQGVLRNEQNFNPWEQIVNGQELRHLKTTKAKALAEIDRAKAEVAYAQRNLQNAQERLGEIEKQLKIATADVRVSDHAMLRYAERAMGLDTEAIKRKILAGDVADKVRLLGNGKFPIGDGMRAIIQDNVVVTVVVEA